MQQSIINTVLSISRPKKRILALSADIVLCLVSVFVAFYLRLGQWVMPEGKQWLTVGASIAIALPLFVSFGFYRAIFRYAGWSALGAVAKAAIIYFFTYATFFTLIGISTVPRTLGIIQPIVLFLAIGFSRVLVRFWLGGGYIELIQKNQVPRVIIYGAGSAGRQLAAALSRNREMQIVGFLDDDPSLQGSVLNGLPIHSPKKLAATIAKLQIDDVLLALPSINRKRRNDILNAIRATHTGVRTLPGLTDLAQGKVRVNDLRELDIEDLLGREMVAPNQLLLAKNITGKTVLVTGAGGSIGSELCRQIMQLRPRKLVLFELSEYALYSIHQELLTCNAESEESGPELLALLGSVDDEQFFSAVLKKQQPATIYHAAAYKHVPLVECNVSQGVRNNVLGTLSTGRAAIANGVSDFVLISTDKAVRPTNIMGASKRLAEMVLQALSAQKSNTRFSMVRFGNVLNSSGSVVPLFRQQVKNGGPVTITHEEVTRYFMTIPEAANLVIQAGAMADGGEVFVLDMGDPVKIIDLARSVIELSGLTVRSNDQPDGDIEIEVIGMRPGEKLYEELLIGDNPMPTRHTRILKANEKFLPWSRLEPFIEKLQNYIETGDDVKLVALLRKLVPEYSPNRDDGNQIFSDHADLPVSLAN